MLEFNNYCTMSVHYNGNKINKIMSDHLNTSQGTNKVKIDKNMLMLYPLRLLLQ